MKPVLTPDQASTLDRETQARGIPAELLMERADAPLLVRRSTSWAARTVGERSWSVARGTTAATASWRRVTSREWGFASPWSPWRPGRPPRAGRRQRVPLGRGGRDPRGAVHARDARPRTGACGRRNDAVFGTGFRGVPEDEWADAIAGLNASPALVVAVDIPSGVNGATGAVDGHARAYSTVRPARRRWAWRILPGAELAGAVRVAHIGFDRSWCERRVSDGARRCGRGPARTGYRHAQARDRGARSVVAGCAT